MREFAQAALAAWFMCGSVPALAAPPSPPAPSAGEEDCPPDMQQAAKAAVESATSATTAEQEARLEALEAANQRLQDQINQLRTDTSDAHKRIDSLLPLSGRISGYLDFGFFDVQGDGSGIRPDVGNVYFPQFKKLIPGGSWVFMGDPLSSTINSRGEPATTAGSRAVTFDAIHNGGKPSFIVNSLNLALFAGIGENVTLNAMIDFLPRGRNVSNPETTGNTQASDLGSFIDFKLGYVEYNVPVSGWGLSLYAGKFDSVLGIEYRSQESSDRISVSPSLICRYTCGRPLGLKARFRFFNESLIFNVAITNSTSFNEYFPFYDEISDTNFKTGSARLSYKIPIGGAGLEIGASGSFGSEGGQVQPASDNVYQWHWGGDLHLLVRDLDLSAEFVHGHANGLSSGIPNATTGVILPCDLQQCIDYRGAYVLLGYRITNWFMPYVRGDWRNALHIDFADNEFIYVTNEMRVTGGLHFEIGTHIITKVEYTHVFKLGGIPQFNSDVMTSSLVVKY